MPEHIHRADPDRQFDEGLDEVDPAAPSIQQGPELTGVAVQHAAAAERVADPTETVEITAPTRKKPGRAS